VARSAAVAAARRRDCAAAAAELGSLKDLRRAQPMPRAADEAASPPVEAEENFVAPLGAAQLAACGAAEQEAKAVRPVPAATPGTVRRSFRQGDDARQVIRSDGRARRRCVASRRGCAHDVWFNDNVCRPADHQKVLDIVAANENEPPAGVHAGVIDHCEPRLAATRCVAESAAAESANRPSGRPDQSKHNQKSQEETDGEWHFRAEHVEHLPYSPCRRCSPSERQWLTAPVTFAVPNTNKELRRLSEITADDDGATLLVVNGGLMANSRRGRLNPPLTLPSAKSAQ